MEQLKHSQIFQIYYSQDQKIHLENEFIPYDNSSSLIPEQCEFPVFRENYINNIHKNALLTGFMSWRFRKKTKLSGKNFIDFTESNPGYDVYYVNPFQCEERYLGVWHQAETCHPGIIELTQSIFDAIGYNIDLRKVYNLSLTSAYCNYWVGTQNFWETYMSFAEPIYEYIIHYAPTEIKSKIFQRADWRDLGYFPFIFERIFSTLLFINKNIKACRYVYSFEELKSQYNENIAFLLSTLTTLDKGDYPNTRDYVRHNIEFHIDTWFRHQDGYRPPEQEIKILEEKLHNAMQNLQHIQNSISWRLTSPLRSILTHFPRIRIVCRYLLKSFYKIGTFQFFK